MRLFGGISLLSGRPYLGVGSSCHLGRRGRSGSSVGRLHSDAKAAQVRARAAAEHAKKVAEINRARLAYDGLLGIDAMLEARR